MPASQPQVFQVVQIVIFVNHGHALLPGAKGKVGSQLQDEGFEFSQNGLFHGPVTASEGVYKRN